MGMKYLRLYGGLNLNALVFIGLSTFPDIRQPLVYPGSRIAGGSPVCFPPLKPLNACPAGKWQNPGGPLRPERMMPIPVLRSLLRFYRGLASQTVLSWHRHRIMATCSKAAWMARKHAIIAVILNPTKT